MIHLFTDFGLAGPYIGQVKAVLARAAPGVPVIDLLADAPPFDAKSAAYLLAAYDSIAAAGDVVVAVVDPGVGSARKALVLEVDDVWYVGPGNGIFEAVLAQAGNARAWEVIWRPAAASASFHGRDIFAPAAARIAAGNPPEAADGWFRPLETAALCMGWPDDWAAVVYVDQFGNLMSGLRESALGPSDTLAVNDSPLPRHRTFSDAEPGEAFCYANSNGLMEVAVNMGRADSRFGLAPGDPLTISRG